MRQHSLRHTGDESKRDAASSTPICSALRTRLKVVVRRPSRAFEGQLRLFPPESAQGLVGGQEDEMLGCCHAEQ